MGDVMSLDQLDKVKADTQEILDKLSDMRATRVSELPGQYTVVSLTGKTETQYTDLVNVTGSGTLRCALVFPELTGSTTAYADIKIIVDGVTYGLDGRSASSGYRYDCGFVVASDILSGDNNTTYGHDSIYGRSINISKDESFPITNPKTGNGSLLFGETELRFENQLIIKGRAHSGSSYDAFILYSLDD